jgi:general secretion pathway protein A
MYLDFFKFKKNPFHITPDPDFLFLSPSHKEASDSIVHGIEERKGFIVITGEVGVGKTTILRSYLEGTDPGRIKIAYIFNSALSFEKLLEQILLELGIQAAGKDLRGLADSLSQYLAHEYGNARNVVLIIDEAQNMPVETLERLPTLSNFETFPEKPLQIILVGQPELEDMLDLPRLKHLKDLTAIRRHIETLRLDESLAYIRHRLMKASLFHNPVFTKDALRRIVKEAAGIPRIINILCDNALITAYGYQRNPVDGKIIKEQIKDLRGGQSRVSSGWKFLLVRAMAACLGLAVLASMALLAHKENPSARTEIFTAEVSEPQPADDPAKGAMVELAAGSVAMEEPRQSGPETADGGSAVETAKPAPIETPREAQPPVAGNTPLPKDAGEQVKESIAAVETDKGPGVEPAVVNTAGEEPGPPAPEAAGGGSVAEAAPLGSTEAPADNPTPVAENAPLPDDAGAQAQDSIAAAQRVKRLEVEPAVVSTAGEEPGPSAPEAAGSGSVAETAPLGSTEAPADNPTPVAENAPLPNDAGEHAQESIAAARRVKRLEVEPAVVSTEREEPAPPVTEAAGGGRLAEPAPPAPAETPDEHRAPVVENAPLPNDAGEQLKETVAAVEMVKEPDVKSAVVRMAKVALGPPAPEVTTAGDGGLTEPAPPVPAETHGEDRAPVAENAPLPNDAGEQLKETVAAVEMVKEPDVKSAVVRMAKAELRPAAPEVAGDGVSSSETGRPASTETPRETQAQVTAKNRIFKGRDAQSRGSTARGLKPQSFQYVVKVGSFVDRDKAENLKTHLNKKGYDAIVKSMKDGTRGNVYVIELQPVGTVSTAATLTAQLNGAIEGKPEIVEVPSP